MRHVRIIGVCLIAAFALSAVVAAGASASQPAFWQCVKAAKNADKKYIGKYINSKCTEEASAKEIEEGKTNKYEFEEWNAAGKGGESKVKEFTGKFNTMFIEIRKVGPFTCKAGTYSGEVTGPKTLGNISLTLTGCEIDKSSFTNTGTAGEIKFNTLKGEIGYVTEVFNKPVEHTTVGLDLSPQSGSYLAEGIYWLTSILRFSGSLIGEVLPPYNALTKEVKLRFQQSAGKQAIQNLEGMPKDTPLTEAWAGTGWNEGEETGFSGEWAGKGEELELKA